MRIRKPVEMRGSAAHSMTPLHELDTQTVHMSLDSANDRQEKVGHHTGRPGSGAEDQMEVSESVSTNEHCMGIRER